MAAVAKSRMNMKHEWLKMKPGFKSEVILLTTNPASGHGILCECVRLP